MLVMGLYVSVSVKLFIFFMEKLVLVLSAVAYKAVAAVALLIYDKIVYITFLGTYFLT